MLTGFTARNLDRKDRVTLPQEFIAKLGPTVRLARAPQGHLLLLPGAAWRELIESREEREWREYWTAAGMVCPVRRNGGSFRVLIPAEYRQHAGLRAGEPVVFSGLGAAVRLSSLERWERWSADLEALVLEIAGRKQA